MNSSAPLAERMRPKTLDDLAGQEHLSGKGSILRTAIERGKIPSMILWGPPGTGKTTIANIIAHTLSVPFIQLSAISAGVKEVREAIAQAQNQSGTILFIDEIHRFNKGQQDALLGAVEKGIITLIGATTENPSFEVNSALLSRCQVYVLKPLEEDDLIKLLHQALEKDEELKKKNIELKETEALLRLSGGDARKLLNLLELVVDSLQSQPHSSPHPGLPPTGEGVSAQAPLEQDNLSDSDPEYSVGEFYREADLAIYNKLKNFVSEHRSNPTKAEEILWQHLRGKQLEKFKFRRQHIIGNYIADFVCLSKRLIVEVDGLIHELPENKMNDEERTFWLRSKDYQVIRFTNEQVLSDIDNTLNEIAQKLTESTPTPRKIFSTNKNPQTGGEGSVDPFPRGGKAGMGALITDEQVMNIAQQRIALYDKSGEQHYDIISAFIKSMRGSDPNGAIYWLARMIEGGEDVKFIARRMVIFASEDISNANPTAIVLANACFDAVNKIGYPEARIILAQCATYLASSHKSNASYVAIEEALEVVRKRGDLSVPLHVRNAPTGLMKRMGYGKNYKYAHSYDRNFIEQEFLPEEIKGTAFYDPGKNPREEELRRFLKSLWKEKYGY
jgi:replication-associated recombination protein RarA/very-short-patch-repair endonuclease